MRLLEKNLGKMSLVENGKSEPVKIGDLSEEMANSSEISMLFVQFEKEMSGMCFSIFQEQFHLNYL